MTAMDTSPKSTNGSLLDLNWTAGMLPVVNGANGSIPDLEIHIPIVNICWQE